MKFFWKLYFSIMLITISCFSVGGYMLIQTAFNNTFEREIEGAYQENDIILSSMTRELKSSFDDRVDQIKDTEKFKIIQDSVASMTIESFSGSISFCLRDESGALIYQNGGFSDDTKIIKNISQNERGYIVQNKNGKYLLRSIRVFTLTGMDIYVENVRDISEVFMNRENQFTTLLYYTVLLSLASGVVIMIVTRWLVRPIKKLSQATKLIASGSSADPVPVYSHDEIGQLTEDFNTMTTRLALMVKELQAAVERQEIFVGNFAHELKTPLTSIIGYGDMLRSKRLDEEEIISYSNLIVEEGKRLEVMSMKLMDLIVLKKEDFKMYWISSKSFFQSVEDTVKVIMEELEIEFIVDVEETNLYLEPDLIKTVCFNLLDNARKAIENKGKIVFKGRILENGYEISISDNGCGMAEAELTKIKEAFYMVDKSRSRSAGGAGLGLAICEQIIELHQATIQFKSTLGKGTTVSILLKGADDNETL